MSDFYPIFTNDGTVGLYSEEDDDIYHSAYGALSESWQKFIYPSCIKDLIDNNEDIKILDICYGIGYNTKSAIQFYINELKRKNKKNFFENILYNFLKNIIILFLNFKIKLKKIFCLHNNISAIDADKNTNKINSISPIYTDNISDNNIINFLNFKNNINTDNRNNNYSIDTDNEIKTKYSKYYSKNKLKVNNYIPTKLESLLIKILNSDFTSNKSKLFVDAIDLDSTLIKLSPLITNKLKKGRKKILTDKINSKK